MLRSQVSDAASFLDLLFDLGETTKEGLANQDYPMVELEKALVAANPQWSETAASQVSFSVYLPGNIAGSGADLTLTSYLFGPRYYWHNPTKFTPFGQILLGGAHAGTSLAGASANAFATKIGGGVDYKLTHNFSLRGQLNYYLTHFDNGTNDHQNNLEIGAGVAFHF